MGSRVQYVLQIDDDQIVLSLSNVEGVLRVAKERSVHEIREGQKIHRRKLVSSERTLEKSSAKYTEHDFLFKRFYFY